jgi:hypothetical protein
VFSLTQPSFITFSNTTRPIKPTIMCLFIQKLKNPGKNVILRDFTNDIKYKLHRLVILDGVSFNTDGVVCKLKLKKFRTAVPN